METDKLYVDKTEQIFNLINKHKAALTIYPRRFGKSIFIDVIRCYFELDYTWWEKHASKLWITGEMLRKIKEKNNNFDRLT